MKLLLILLSFCLLQCGTCRAQINHQAVLGQTIGATFQSLYSNPNGYFFDASANAYKARLYAFPSGNDAMIDNFFGTTNSAFFTLSDRSKLLSIAAGATVNSTDAALRARASHTGTQDVSTVTGLTKSSVDLGNVDNTADATKPISTATATALSNKADSVLVTAALNAKSATTQIDVYNVPGSYTWTKPADAKTVSIILIAGGAGGGSGRKGAASTIRAGGSGGGAAGLTRLILPASALAASQPVVVGAGGAGGAAIAAVSTIGQNGLPGGATSFGAAGADMVVMQGASGGQGGNISSGIGGNGTSFANSEFSGIAGSGANVTTNGATAGTGIVYNNGGAASGGSINAANAAFSGGTGGSISPFYGSAIFGGSAGAVNFPGSQPTFSRLPADWRGGPGSGGGGASVTGNAGNGADGKSYGAGGAGGGAATDGVGDSGKGGNGKGGIVIVTTTF